ncbi:MAG TPA: Ig-like domain-containing protein [Ramlibacter sp.]|jgi:hypothetical protein
MKNALRTHVAAALLLLPVSAAFIAPAAMAQQQVQLGIFSASLNSSAGLGPGSVLWLRVNATPGGQNASVTLGDSGVRVALRESNSGSYTGTYTVRNGDRIDPMQLMAMRVTVNGRTVMRNFTFPPAFQALAAPAPAAGNVAAAPVIDRFELQPGGRLRPGRELRFTVTGQPRARASIEIPGVISGVELKETRPGVYQGSYTIRRVDDPRNFDSAVATLRRGPLATTARLELRNDEDRRAGPYRDNRWDDNRGDNRADRGQQPVLVPVPVPVPPQQSQRDAMPPKITRVSPAEGELVAQAKSTVISARLADAASGVDPASVQLRVDGVDVTTRTNVSAQEIRFRDVLARGPHNAELIVRDRAGNIARTAWSFQIR